MDQQLDKIVAQLSASTVPRLPSTGCLPPREVTRVASTRKPLPTRRRPDLESDGSAEETDSSEN
ncbi:hypothetical protein FKM82_029933 [Ascaphus truei]